MITRMLPVKATKLMIDMVVVKKIEAAFEQLECSLVSLRVELFMVLYPIFVMV